MKRLLSAFLVLLLTIFLVPVTTVHAAPSGWTISYNVVWDGSVYKLENVAVNMGGETAVSATLTLPSSITLASETAGAGWTNRAEASGSISYLTPANNTAADFVTYLESLTFTGTYGTSTGNISFQLFGTQMSSWVDPNGFTHYYEFVPTVLEWDDAYNAAKGRTYRGLTGFLATITSLDEHNFIYDSIATNPGWLGGMRYINVNDGSRFVNAPSISDADFDLDRDHGDKWYWACGCAEAGQDFYGTAVYNATEGNASAPGATPYYNWFVYEDPVTHAMSYEPNRSEWGGQQPEGVLQFAEDGTKFWNDLGWYNVHPLQNNGYYVEYTDDSACGQTMTPADAMFSAPLPMPAAPTSTPDPGPFLVTFLDCNGNTLKVEWVPYGGSATAPGGFETYSGYTNVTSHMDLSPNDCSIPNKWKVPPTGVE